AGGKLRAAQLGRRADRTGNHRGRPAERHRGAVGRALGARGGVARAHRPRQAVPARHGSRRERAVGPRAVGAAVRRRPRNADSAGDHPRHRRRPRAESARLGSIGVLSQRGPRAMGGSIWPELPESDRPVGSVTNGVHGPTWMASELADLFTRHLGAGWLDRHDDPALWDGVLAIPDQELWAVRQALRRYLFAFVRERARQRWTEEGGAITRVVAAGPLLEPEALTLGFARRFAGYKRPELIFHD